MQLPPSWITDELGWPTGRGVRVGIVNSGFDRTLHDQRVVPGVSFVDPEDDLAMLRTDDDHDRLGEGTACADLVLRIAPEARVVPIRIFGNGLETSPGVLHAALLWALEQDISVLTLGAGSQVEEVLHPLYAACEKLRHNGTIIVASGHQENDWSYPGIFENVIGVSSGSFSSPYEYRYHPDAAYECEALGDYQWVLWLGGEMAVRGGTMYAAAHLAGIVALLRERYPGATLEQIRALLRKYAVDPERPHYPPNPRPDYPPNS